MKYQVVYEVSIQGEISVEADTPEEAREMAIEAVADIRVNGELTDFLDKYVGEPYEWDEAAQERHRKETEKLFNKFQTGN